jgi:hypothetical protein
MPRGSSRQRRGAREPKATAAPGHAEEFLRVLQGRSQRVARGPFSRSEYGLWLGFDSGLLPPLWQSGYGVWVGFPGRRPAVAPRRRTCPGLVRSAPLARKHRDPLTQRAFGALSRWLCWTRSWSTAAGLDRPAWIATRRPSSATLSPSAHSHGCWISTADSVDGFSKSSQGSNRATK